jgi:hypothetical protein
MGPVEKSDAATNATARRTATIPMEKADRVKPAAMPSKLAVRKSTPRTPCF